MLKRLFTTTLFLCAAQNAWSYSVLMDNGNPIKWDSPIVGEGADLSWSLATNGSVCLDDTCSHLDTLMPAGYVGEITRAFDAWAEVADITFTFFDESNPGPFTGDLRLGAHAIENSGSGNVLAHAIGSYYSDSTWAKGEVHFDTAETWTIGSAGVDIFSVALHEIGHALGLGHSDVAGAVMDDTFNTSTVYTGLTADDIAGIQYLYGVNENWVDPSEVPVPAAAWLFGSALLSLGAARRRKV